MDRECRVCKETKPLELFSKDRTGSHGYKLMCLECFRAYARTHYANTKDAPENRERRRAVVRRHDLKRKYGITPEQHDAMIDAQGALCAICLIPKSQVLHVDHCHKTGRVRMLLCTKCNQGLGYFNDSPEIMRRASEYLQKVHDPIPPTPPIATTVQTVPKPRPTPIIRPRKRPGPAPLPIEDKGIVVSLRLTPERKAKLRAVGARGLSEWLDKQQPDFPTNGLDCVIRRCHHAVIPSQSGGLNREQQMIQTRYTVLNKQGFCVYASPNLWECERFMVNAANADRANDGYMIYGHCRDDSRDQSAHGCAAHL